jgi:hypothetical protein
VGRYDFLKATLLFLDREFPDFTGCSNRFAREEPGVQKSIAEFLNAEPNDKFMFGDNYLFPLATIIITD